MANIIEITSPDLPELQIFSRFSEPQLLHYFEPDEGVFLAESPRVIERALDAGYTPMSMLAEPADIKGQAAGVIARCGDIPVYTGEPAVLTEAAGFKLIRGAVCAMRRKPLPTVEEICRQASRIAVLENVVNPTNIGAIIRSAAALDMDAVLLTPSCSDPLYRRSSRVSMGTVFQVPWTYLPSERGYVELLRKMDFMTAALALCEDTISIEDPSLQKATRLALILGTEGEGLSQETILASDCTVKIPMSHGVDSLNVAAASAVAFWQVRKKP